MKGKWSLALLGLLGILALLFGGGLGEGQETAADTEGYRKVMEAEVASLLSEVEGVSEVSVLLTLEAGESSLFAEDEGGYLTVGGDGLLIEKRPPRVAGVAVVCRGGGDARVQETVKALLSASLGIGTHRVVIAEKK